MKAPQALAVVVLSVATGVGVAIAGGVGGATVAGGPLMLWLTGWCFVINWLAFVPAFLWRTERFYDLTGSLTFITVVALALGLSPGPLDARAWLSAAMVSLWALRLGAFLFRRVHSDGGDGRFDEIKQSAPRFLVAWTVQGLWVFLTSSAALIAITSHTRVGVDATLVVGVCVWALGFGIEIVADWQKRKFRRAPGPHRFIDSGLWRLSRHPNYFGEIVLWVGVLVVSSSTFVGTQWVAVLSPIFVFVLLTRVSGIPLLEARADARFEGDPAYAAYKASTSVLVPWPPSRP